MPREVPEPSGPSRPLRAALLGLCLGCLLGGASLLGMGTYRLATAPACPEARGSCVLEQELAEELGVRQLGFGGALSLLGVGLWLLGPRHSFC